MQKMDNVSRGMEILKKKKKTQKKLKKKRVS